ncbi:hypothetical protein [Streptomyces olivochromogenes]|uniref:Uncharacterized protein n=1 Tax=Streptomyces olivochromogenes TaxID=1963 RepID=A0A250VTC9_STROL|nr:hypothetical protein [Streptomyces olivochromogenes]GAX57282.1 hypothetical protein SO3561_08852 [Streptomyces olivochromogenes]
MGAGEQLGACDECGSSRGRVRDLGLRDPLALCGDCLNGAVTAWRGIDPTPLTTSEVERAAAAGMDPRMLRRRLDTAREGDTA